jgi:hypothetical protein
MSHRYSPKIVSANTYENDVRSLMGFWNMTDPLSKGKISDIIHLAPAEQYVIRAIDNKLESVEDKVSLHNAVIAGVAYNLCDAVYKEHVERRAYKEEYLGRMNKFIKKAKGGYDEDGEYTPLDQ